MAPDQTRSITANLQNLLSSASTILWGSPTTLENRYEKLEFDDLDEQSVGFTQQGGWIAFLQHYFLSAWVPPANEQNRFEASRSRDGNYLFRTIGQAKQIAPGDQGIWQAGFYAGPKDQIRLEEIAPYLNMTVDYGFCGGS